MRELIAGRRPDIDAQARVEVGGDEDAEHGAFDDVDAQLPPPERRLARNIERREVTDVERFHGFRVLTASAPHVGGAATTSR